MATKAVILSQKKGDAADILLPHTSADLTGYTHASVQDGESVKDALDYLLKTQTSEGSELDGRVSALEKEIDAVEEAAQAAQTVASAAQTAAEQWSAEKPGIVKRVDDLEAQKAPIQHASAEETYGKGDATNYGHVKLSDTAGDSDAASGGTAVTPKALQGYLPLTGGDVTGQINFCDEQGTKKCRAYYNSNYGMTIQSTGDHAPKIYMNEQTFTPYNGWLTLRVEDEAGMGRDFNITPDGTITWCDKTIATKDGAAAASMIAVNAEQGAVYTLPEGGTYAYSIQKSATGETTTGVAAGGSEISTQESGIHGFAMKIQ